MSRGVTGVKGELIPKEEFDRIFALVPRLTIDTLVEVAPGKYLLSKRKGNIGDGYWHIPGGTQKRPATIEDTAIAITEHETGLKLNTVEPLGVIEYAAEDLAVGQSTSIIYLAKADGEWHSTNEGTVEAFSLDNLPEPMIPEVREFLTKFKDRGKNTQLAAIKSIEPRRMDPLVFTALAKIVVFPAIETIVLRELETDRWQVLLTRRPEDDPTESIRGQLHSPGTILRASDETIEHAFERIQRGEFGMEFAFPPILAGVHFHHYERGGEIGVVYACRVQPEQEINPKFGVFYDTDNLPEDTIEHHKELIPIAVQRAKANGQLWTN